MRWGTAVVMVLGLAFSPAALACATPQPTFEQDHRKLPLTGRNIRMHALFGMQMYLPIKQRLMHYGVDWIAAIGTPVVAVAAGRVVVAGYHHVIGNTVAIDHGNGWETRYQHLANLIVRPGACVQRGQVIGTIGNTGQGFHSKVPVTSNGKESVVHVEVLHHGQHRNPLSLSRPK